MKTLMGKKCRRWTPGRYCPAAQHAIAQLLPSSTGAPLVTFAPLARSPAKTEAFCSVASCAGCNAVLPSNTTIRLTALPREPGKRKPRGATFRKKTREPLDIANQCSAGDQPAAFKRSASCAAPANCQPSSGGVPAGNCGPCDRNGFRGRSAAKRRAGSGRTGDSRAGQPRSARHFAGHHHTERRRHESFGDQLAEFLGSCGLDHAIQSAQRGEPFDQPRAGQQPLRHLRDAQFQRPAGAGQPVGHCRRCRCRGGHCRIHRVHTADERCRRARGPTGVRRRRLAGRRAQRRWPHPCAQWRRGADRAERAGRCRCAGAVAERRHTAGGRPEGRTDRPRPGRHPPGVAGARATRP